MRTTLVLGLAVALVAFAFVAAPAQADDPTAICTMSMPPTCKVSGAPTVSCTMSMPPECRTG